MALGTDLLDRVHARKIEYHSAVQGHSLAVVPCARAAGGDGNVVRVAVAENISHFGGANRLNNEIADFSVELFPKNRRIPVEIARQLFNDWRMREHPCRILKKTSQAGGVAQIHRTTPFQTLQRCLFFPCFEELQVRKAFCMLGCVKSVTHRSRSTGPSTPQAMSERRATSRAGMRI